MFHSSSTFVVLVTYFTYSLGKVNDETHARHQKCLKKKPNTDCQKSDLTKDVYKLATIVHGLYSYQP